MVVPAGGARLAVHVLLLLLLLLVATQPLLVSMAVTSSSRAGLASDYTNATVHVAEEQQQADMPFHGQADQQHQEQQRLQPIYREGMAARGEENSMLADGVEQDAFHTEDIQVGCRELRAKRYISDGFCTSTKPIKEVVCTGNCLPIMELPWYAEFVNLWSERKVKEWQCEEGVVRKKSVHLLCRNGHYRTYRIKVVKSCKCKNVASKDNRTHPRKGGKKKKKGRRRKKKGGGRKRGGKKSRKSNSSNNGGKDDGQKQEEKGEGKGSVAVGASRGRSKAAEGVMEEEVVEVDVSQTDQRQDETSRQRGEGGGGGGRRRGGRKGRKSGDRKRKDRKTTATNSGGVVSGEAGQGGVDSDSPAPHKDTRQDSLSPSTP